MGSKRSFTVESAHKAGGCPTKSHGGRYISHSPLGAAKKAFNELCRVKKIRGRCTLVIIMRETTSGSAKKTFKYKLERKKLKNPITLEGKSGTYKIEYKVHGKKFRGTLKGKNCKQSVGRMKRKTSRKIHGGNNDGISEP